ncbi:MAG: dUTP diphosphatase, partial [OM182 bacterium MED-G28]
LPQLQMELIDIWHFILSEILLRNSGNVDASLAALMILLDSANTQKIIDFDDQQYSIDELDLLTKLELLIALSVVRRIELSLFQSIMSKCQIGWLDLYRQYVGKNVLNMFRQDHGYKDGSYQKIWNGREDNEYLVEIIDSLDPNQAKFKDQVYIALKSSYPA